MKSKKINNKMQTKLNYVFLGFFIIIFSALFLVAMVMNMYKETCDEFGTFERYEILDLSTHNCESECDVKHEIVCSDEEDNGWFSCVGQPIYNICYVDCMDKNKRHLKVYNETICIKTILVKKD